MLYSASMDKLTFANLFHMIC